MRSGSMVATFHSIAGVERCPGDHTSAATLTSSPNPSTQGQAVTFTATISSPTVMPTGPVTFTSGKTVLWDFPSSLPKQMIPIDQGDGRVLTKKSRPA
jgi:hypothetical protein